MVTWSMIGLCDNMKWRSLRSVWSKVLSELETFMIYFSAFIWVKIPISELTSCLSLGVVMNEPRVNYSQANVIMRRASWCQQPGLVSSLLPVVRWENEPSFNSLIEQLPATETILRLTSGQGHWLLTCWSYLLLQWAHAALWASINGSG